MTESEVASFQEKVRRMKIHAQGMAVREESGNLRALTDDEKIKLGVDIAMARDVSLLIGRVFQIPGTTLTIQLTSESD